MGRSSEGCYIVFIKHFRKVKVLQSLDPCYYQAIYRFVTVQALDFLALFYKFHNMIWLKSTNLSCENTSDVFKRHSERLLTSQDPMYVLTREIGRNGREFVHFCGIY